MQIYSAVFVVPQSSECHSNGFTSIVTKKPVPITIPVSKELRKTDFDWLQKKKPTFES